MVEQSTFTSVIYNRGFLNLWTNQILVQLSYHALNFALIVWVFQLTGSSTATSILLFSIYLPAVLLGLFSGVLVDVTDRKKIIMFIDFFLSISFFSLIFLKESYFAILGIAFFVNALGQFYGPAEASAIPMVVKKHQLITANSVFSTTLFSCFLLGFGLSGPLINLFGIDFIFISGGILLFLAFLLSLVFPSIQATPDSQGRKLLLAFKKMHFQDIKEVGTEEIVKTLRMIKGKLTVSTSIMILAGVQMVIGVLAVVMSSFLERSLQIKATDASLVLVTPLGAGIIVGGLILGKFGNKIIKRKLVSKAILLGGLMFFWMGISPIISPAIKYLTNKPLPFFYQPPLSSILISGSFLLGLCLVAVLVPTQTVLQENTLEKDRGKVFATLGVAMAGLSLIPVLISGVLADIFGPTPIFISLGVTIISIGLFGLRPNFFFSKKKLPFKVREFLGLGHWDNK